MASWVLLGQANLVEQFARAFEAVGAEWVLWLLISLSVISVAIMIERALYFFTHSMGNVDDVAEQLRKGQLDAALKSVAAKRGMEAEVVRVAVTTSPAGPESVEEAVAETIVRERLRYERFLSFLGTLGNNAPFVGLFGTVLGIVTAFAELAKNAKAGSMTSGSGNVMGGISEALIATAVGLLVALPAVAIYNLFMRWLKTIVARSNALGHAVQSHLKALPPETPAEAAPAAPVALKSVAG